MLLGILTGPTVEDLRRQIAKGKAHVDGFEWRLDYLTTEAFNQVAKLKEETGMPSLFTLRPTSQGGRWHGTEEERQKLIENLFFLAPTYFDLEATCPSTWLHKMIEQHPSTRVVLSYHDYEKTPQNLDALFLQLQKIPAYCFKMAFHACSTLDMLRLLCFVKQAGARLSGISMGKFGQPGRILGPIVGNFFDYTSLTSDTHLEKAGLVPLEEWITHYRYHSLGLFTTVYALIGDPVEPSISHITHNAFMQDMKWNQVYVKLCVKKNELAEFFFYAQQLPFRGFSVTMPLKESILPFVTSLHESALQSGVINTLVLHQGKWMGANTDGQAATFLIEQKEALVGKRCVIIGAGGTARAIACEAIQRGAHVRLVNRTVEKAEQFAKKWGCEAYPLSALSQVLQQGYDVLVHATSVGFSGCQQEAIVRKEDLLSGKIVLEIVSRPKRTQLIERAEKQGCRVIDGEELFMCQARKQFELWV